ncbi:uncharacterized protein LALA0_S08e07382g [Lachancea lanzarotensis]|uniref:LALA0S08e07382g1_1 n=1 Tax=Lachancea lanzarotensis TaxID=1245769 RepID=A0A0C7N0H9_9SACH|nr:uncharacterized protein LALA0_S08e07382g [Lachancea lanzarotensis]CEP63646.1 LALA0S08e07382g1_1 [Lachancea lanzarotensis]
MKEDFSEKLLPLDEKTVLANSNSGSSLPDSKIKSQVAWLTKELWTSRAFRIAGSVFASLVLVETVVLHVKSVKPSLVLIAIASTLAAFVLFLIAAAVIFGFMREIVAKKQRYELCRLVMFHQPGLTSSNWDVIAVSMNAFLKREGHWHTATCFESGLALFYSYRQRVYLPLKKGNFDNDADVALLSDAAASYEKSFRVPQIPNEKTEASSAALKEQELPVEVYRSKTSWALAFLAKQFLFGCFFALIYSFSYRGYAKLMGVAIELAPVPIHLFTRGKGLSVTQVGQFLKTVEDLEPWEDNSKWGDVAKALNQFLGSNKNTYLSAGLFYDGDDCRRIFESNLSSITSSRIQNIPEVVSLVTGKQYMPEFVTLATELQAACGLDVAECVWRKGITIEWLV